MVKAAWERQEAVDVSVDAARLEELARQILIEIGEDPTREGLRETPRRYAQWWKEFVEYDAGKVDTLFESSTLGQTVMVSGMAVWSLCEHHLLPFSCDLTVAYKSGGVLLGLSKFARIAHKHAHKLQVQERLVVDIADEISDITGTNDLAVMGRGEHLCMTMRGIRTPSTMSSSIFRGVFDQSERARAELFAQLGVK
ncbi:GTP cyclohydrolase I FolE [Streptomyces sp. NPDC039022]|uniref:GTP cyclohydrolase I n=1 Tax=Streptomyces sp. NPDC039022 TaxID=3157091 RepID=UPI0033E91BF3